jgi:hypothetical protein
MQYKTEYKTINGKTKKVPEKKDQDKKTDVKTSNSSSSYDKEEKSYKGE